MEIQEAYPGAERIKSFVPLGGAQPQRLGQADIDHFNERGYLCPLEVFSPEESRAIRTYFDELSQAAAARGWNSYGILDWHASCRGLHDLVTEPRILDYLQDLLGPDLVCWGTHFFTKMPGDGKRVSWHQDASFWPLTPSKTVTVWLAIDDVDEENAAMQVIPGTHLLGQLPFAYSHAEENNVLDQTVMSIEDYEESPVTLGMKAGQISLHTDWLLHGSGVNHSSRRRCGLTMRFVSPDVRNVFMAKQASGVVARGRDARGYWQHVPCPTGEEIPDPPPADEDWQKRSGWKKAYDAAQAS